MLRVREWRDRRLAASGYRGHRGIGPRGGGGGACVRGRPSKVKGAFGVASRWTSSTLDFGASAAPEAALGAGSACPAPGRATPPPPSVRYQVARVPLCEVRNPLSMRCEENRRATPDR